MRRRSPDQGAEDTTELGEGQTLDPALEHLRHLKWISKKALTDGQSMDYMGYIEGDPTSINRPLAEWKAVILAIGGAALNDLHNNLKANAEEPEVVIEPALAVIANNTLHVGIMPGESVEPILPSGKSDEVSEHLLFGLMARTPNENIWGIGLPVGPERMGVSLGLWLPQRNKFYAPERAEIMPRPYLWVANFPDRFERLKLFALDIPPPAAVPFPAGLPHHPEG